MDSTVPALSRAGRFSLPPGEETSFITPGEARLRCELVAGQSALTSVYATSPVKLLTPRSRGKSVWTSLATLGGGMLAGDETSLDLEIGAGARCLVSTQASTKIYRNPSGRPCSHRVRAQVDDGGFLALVPDAVQCFAGASFDQRQLITLHGNAGLVLTDWCSSGRVARGERWAFTRYASRIEILNSTGRRLFIDSLLLDPADGGLDSRMRLGRFNCLALLLVLGRELRAPAQELLGEVGRRPVSRRAELICAASPIGDGALLRIAGECLEHVANEIRARLDFLAGFLGDNPFARKW